MVPVRICFAIQDERCSLPGMEQCILNVNGSDYSFNNPDTTIEARSLPGYYRLRTIPISLHSDRFYHDESFPLTVSFGIRQDAIIQLHRDSTIAISKKGYTVYQRDDESPSDDLTYLIHRE